MPVTPDEVTGTATKDSSHRSACTECQRRKQKCNREWPCNHCQKRKVADKCHFKDAVQPVADKAKQETRTKRRRDNEDEYDLSDSDEADGDGIDALGYMPSHVLYGLTSQDEIVKSSSREYIRDARSFPQLERALQVIPPRPYTDTLVQNFLNNVNFHYYIIYPQTFHNQYHQWWTDRAANRPLCIQWTSLLLMVCACASQYTDLELQRKLEIDLGDTIQRLTEQYHEAARELGSSIPIGYSHLTNVQQLLHSCYWFKSEARFVECWHVLNSAIREAQELAMHKESPDDPIPEFELEMRRRVWCVLDTWDWQISALLGRPMIIDRADCNVELPTLSLESFVHHPLTHMKLQSSLIRKLFGRFGLTKNVTAPADVQEYQCILENWIRQFPPPFRVHNPDHSLDLSCPWIVLHRHYIRTMAFSMLLDPIRAYLARAFTIDSTDAELQIRSDGIDYCLELMVSLRGFFDHVYPRDAKFHFVLFCIFDTSTVLCSAVLHDQYHTLPRRDDVFRAIDEALAMLQRLNTVTKSAKTSYGILSRIVHRLPRTRVVPRSPEENGSKRPRITEVPISPHMVAHQDMSPPLMTQHGPSEIIGVPYDPLAINPYVMAEPTNYAQWHPVPEPYISPPPQMPPPTHMAPPAQITSPLNGSLPLTAPVTGMSYNDGMQAGTQDGNFAYISDQELGELASLWNYQSLDFNFISPP